MLSIEFRWAGLRLTLLAAAFLAPLSLRFVRPYPPFVLAIWVATAAAIAFAARDLWPELRFGGGLVTILASAGLAWGAVLGALVATWFLAATSLCGKDPGWFLAGPVLAAYGLVGSWALAGRPRRAVLGWPLAVLVAAAVGLAVLSLLPDAPGYYCDS